MKKLAVSFAVALLLIFGCFVGGGENNGASGTNGGAGASAGAGEGASASNGGSSGGNNNGGSGGSGASGGTNWSNGSGEGGFEVPNGSENGVSNKTLEELSQMDVLVVCDLELTENSPEAPGLVSFKLYLWGGDYKIEMITNEDGETKEYAMIKIGEYVYSNSLYQYGGYEEALGDCYWMKEKAVSKELSDFEVELKRTETTYACAIEEFGDEKLETPGKVCTFEELLNRT